MYISGGRLFGTIDNSPSLMVRIRTLRTDVNPAETPDPPQPQIFNKSSTPHHSAPKAMDRSESPKLDRQVSSNSGAEDGGPEEWKEPRLLEVRSRRKERRQYRACLYCRGRKSKCIL